VGDEDPPHSASADLFLDAVALVNPGRVRAAASVQRQVHLLEKDGVARVAAQVCAEADRFSDTAGRSRPMRGRDLRAAVLRTGSGSAEARIVLRSLSQKLGAFLSLFAELQRRRVFRALVGYGVAAFAVLQIF